MQRKSKSAKFKLRLPAFLVPEPMGLGDAIKRVTSAAGIRTCDNCERRAQALNDRVLFVPWSTSD